MFTKILNLAQIGGLVTKLNIPSVNYEQFCVGPTGCLLKENLKAEWLYSTVSNKDVIVFLSSSDVSSTLNYAKRICSEKLPFGIAEMTKDTGEDHNILDDQKINFNALIKDEDNLLLRYSIFISPNHSTSIFHQMQRQRRMWWRKFSASPDRYLLTDVKTKDSNTHNVEILSKYLSSSHLVETLTLCEIVNDFTSEQLKFSEGKRTIQAHKIVTEINLSTLFFNTICDAFDEPTFQKKIRPLFRFHRKLAPYKISFAIAACDAVSTSELSELALYLSKQLKANHIQTLLLPSSSKNALETQYTQYDQMGVLYTVVLNENTLKNGILQLRSRDTTLKEQVHVADLITNVEQLFKNY